MTPSDERSRVTPSDDVFLDVGAKSKQEAEALGVRPGDPNRVGCVMLIETLHRLKGQGVKIPNTIYFVGTVQEEVTLRGAVATNDHAESGIYPAIETMFRNVIIELCARDITSRNPFRNTPGAFWRATGTATRPVQLNSNCTLRTRSLLISQLILRTPGRSEATSGRQEMFLPNVTQIIPC